MGAFDFHVDAEGDSILDPVARIPTNRKAAVGYAIAGAFQERYTAALNESGQEVNVGIGAAMPRAVQPNSDGL